MSKRKRATRRAPFVMSVVVLASATELSCGASSDDECASATPNQKCSSDGTTCSVDATCQSGSTKIALKCENGSWTPQSCAHEGDECTPRYHCSSGTWDFFGGGGNPPAPCPQALPSDGSECRSGSGFGADSKYCGYLCESGSGWIIAECIDGTTDTWKPGTCDPNG